MLLHHLQHLVQLIVSFLGIDAVLDLDLLKLVDFLRLLLLLGLFVFFGRRSQRGVLLADLQWISCSVVMLSFLLILAFVQVGARVCAVASWLLLLAAVLLLSLFVLRLILADEEPLLVSLLVEFQLIELDSLLLPLALELPQRLQRSLWLSFSFLDFFAVFDDSLPELLPDHALNDVLTVLLPWRPVSEEVVLGLLAVQDLNLHLLERV